MYEDLTDYVKLESPPILTEKIFFARPLGVGWAPGPPFSTPVGKTTLVCHAWPMRRQTYGYLQPQGITAS